MDRWSPMSALQIDPGAGVEDQRALPTFRLKPSLSWRVPITSGSILAAIEELERAASAPSDDALHLERLDALEAEVREVLSLVDQPLEGARWMAVGRLSWAGSGGPAQAGRPTKVIQRPSRCSSSIRSPASTMLLRVASTWSKRQPLKQNQPSGASRWARSWAWVMSTSA